MTTVDIEISRDLAARRFWRAVTGAIVAAMFIEAAFAGAMLSGFEWARRAHMGGAAITIGATLIASLAAFATLRRVKHGARLGLYLMALAAVALAQAAVGVASAKGGNLLWLHVPLGVALVGLAAQSVAGARRLGEA